MDLDLILKAIAKTQKIEIRTLLGEKLYGGYGKNIVFSNNNNWLVHEVKLSDANNYNSTYIITVY